MNPAIFQSAFFTVALPIMVTLMATVWTAQWSQNKRFDDLSRRFDDLKADMNRRFEEINQRLIRIEAKLDNHEERLVRLEERTSPVRL